MRTIGFPKPSRTDERRLALLPDDMDAILERRALYFESGYGEALGISDEAYEAQEANVTSRSQVLNKDIVCTPKTLTRQEFAGLRPGCVVFGWIHAVQQRAVVESFIGNNLTGIAWEDMYVDGRHVFWRNNEIAGEAAILHAFLCHGLMPRGCRGAVVGRGNCAGGAVRVLNQLGCEVVVYDRKTVRHIRGDLASFDVIVNAVKWDVFQSGHLISREDLSCMKPGSMIVDISCDEAMGIETSRPTSISEPTYTEQGIVHYAVDHTPTLLYKTASKAISEAVAPYISALASGVDHPVLKEATIIRDGQILDDRIVSFQHRR